MLRLEKAIDRNSPGGGYQSFYCSDPETREAADARSGSGDAGETAVLPPHHPEDAAALGRTLLAVAITDSAAVVGKKLGRDRRTKCQSGVA